MASENDLPKKTMFSVDWTFSIPDIIAIIGVLATFIYTQSMLNSRIDILHVRHEALRSEVQDVRGEIRVDRRDMQIQLREINQKLDLMIGRSSGVPAR
jgi:hypothetical protein